MCCTREVQEVEGPKRLGKKWACAHTFRCCARLALEMESVTGCWIHRIKAPLGG